MKIIMVCSGNTCRSPMAEALLKAALSARAVDGIEVSSAGVYAREGDLVSAHAVMAMLDRGLDISGHRARPLLPGDAAGALLLCMTPGHVRAVRQMMPDADARSIAEYAGSSGDVPDPFGSSIATYRGVAIRLWELAERIADKLAVERAFTNRP